MIFKILTWNELKRNRLAILYFILPPSSSLPSYYRNQKHVINLFFVNQCEGDLFRSIRFSELTKTHWKPLGCLFDVLGMLEIFNVISRLVHGRIRGRSVFRIEFFFEITLEYFMIDVISKISLFELLKSKSLSSGGSRLLPYRAVPSRTAITHIRISYRTASYYRVWNFNHLINYFSTLQPIRFKWHSAYAIINWFW